MRDTFSPALCVCVCARMLAAVTGLLTSWEGLSDVQHVSPQSRSFLPFRCCLGIGEESFRPVRQRDGQREKQDGGDEQELCESTVPSFPQAGLIPGPFNPACLCLFRRTCPWIQTRTPSARRPSWRTQRWEMSLPKCSRRAHRRAVLPGGYVQSRLFQPQRDVLFYLRFQSPTLAQIRPPSPLKRCVTVNRSRRLGEQLKTRRAAWRRWPLDITSTTEDTWWRRSTTRKPEIKSSTRTSTTWMSVRAETHVERGA